MFILIVAFCTFRVTLVDVNDNAPGDHFQLQKKIHFYLFVCLFICSSFYHAHMELHGLSIDKSASK